MFIHFYREKVSTTKCEIWTVYPNVDIPCHLNAYAISKVDHVFKSKYRQNNILLTKLATGRVGAKQEMRDGVLKVLVILIDSVFIKN